MAVARHSENIDLQEEDHIYENRTTITVRGIHVEKSVDGHHGLQEKDDAIYDDLQTKEEYDLRMILQSGEINVTTPVTNKHHTFP